MALEEPIGRVPSSSGSSNHEEFDSSAAGPEQRLLQERDVEEAVLPHRKVPMALSVRAASNLFISVVGAGVLGLPYAFRRSGLIQGTVVMIIIAALNLHCMLLLVKCKKRLVASTGAVTYNEVASHVLGKIGQRVVEVLLILSQSGFCVAYLVFIAQNLEPMTGYRGVYFILLACPIVAAITMLTGVRALAPFSLIADVANVLGIIVVFYDYFGAFKRPAEVVQFKSVSNLPFLFGVVIYSYEGVGMILPVEASMKRKEKFPLTLTFVMSIITVIYVSFGAIGYAAFGEETRDIITLNLPHDWTTVAVKLALCLGLLFTFPVMMVPVFEILERSLKQKESFKHNYSSKGQSAVIAGVRIALVLLIALVAAGVPGFGLFIALIGSLACASLSFIVPALCHLILFKSDLNWFWKGKDVFLIIFGTVGAVCGSAQAIIDIVKALRQ
ncbi:hypothetical protein ABBQ38_004643 [Trebouxia sp. C0009 RCD-2024]